MLLPMALKNAFNILTCKCQVQGITKTYLCPNIWYHKQYSSGFEHFGDPCTTPAYFRHDSTDDMNKSRRDVGARAH